MNEGRAGVCALFKKVSLAQGMNVREIGWYVLVLVLVALATLWYVERRNLIGRYMDHQNREGQIRAAVEHGQALEQKIQASRDHVEHLNNDPYEIEAAVRHKKGLVREGEKVYRIEQVPIPAPSGAGAADAGAPSRN